LDGVRLVNEPDADPLSLADGLDCVEPTVSNVGAIMTLAPASP
jgi:hypothetical protein